MRKMLIKIFLCLAICLIAGTAYGDQTTAGAQPSPAIFFRLAPSGIFGDRQYLYVMAGGKIMPYEITEMTLLLH
jgi:hypothetical protein